MGKSIQDLSVSFLKTACELVIITIKKFQLKNVKCTPAIRSVYAFVMTYK